MNMSFRLTPWMGKLLCVLALALTACGGGDDPPPPNQVGPAGGTITGPNGTQVVVPAGALSAPVLITITPAAVRPLPPGMQALGTTYDLGPTGTRFAVPVTVTLPLDPAQVPAGAQVRMLHELHGAGSDAWEALPGLALGATSASAQTTSFSHVTLTLGNSPPSITLQPANLAVSAPSGASFNVGFTGTPGFDVQWERSNDGGINWTNAAPSQSVNSAPGSSTLTLGATSAAAASAGGDNGALFRAAIRNIETLPASPVLSNVVTLTVTANVVAPTITTQPQSVSGAIGNASFSVVATGTNLVYQWHKDGVAIAGATNASLNLANVQASDAGDYTVVVSNLVNGAAINSVTSNVATLTVTAAAGSLAIDAFEIVGPPARLPPPTQTGQFGSFTPAAAVTCSLHPTVANLLEFAAGSAPGTQGGRLSLHYDTLTRQVHSVGYSSRANIVDPDFRYLCLANSPDPRIRACTGVTVSETNRTFTFVDVVLDFDFPSFVVPNPSDIRLNGTLNVPTCFP